MSGTTDHTQPAETDHEQCPVCLQDGVVVTAGSSWRKCRNCEASWNSRYTASPRAVTYQSPNGTSLTRCCCDRTTARLVVCPVHPTGHVSSPGVSSGGAAE